MDEKIEAYREWLIRIEGTFAKTADKTGDRYYQGEVNGMSYALDVFNIHFPKED